MIQNEEQQPLDTLYSVPIMYTIGVIGIVAALDNAFVLAIFFWNRKLLSSSSLLVGLTIAHSLNGVLHALFEFYPRNFTVIPVFDCIKLVYPILFIVTYQTLPVLLALNGVERLLALATPAWYRVNCTNDRLWALTAGAFGLALLSLLGMALKAYLDKSSIPDLCLPPDIVGVNFMVYGVHLPAVLGGVCAGACTSVGVWIGRRRIAKMPMNSTNEIRRVKKQLRLTQCLLLISVIDLICVVITNIIYILYNLQLIHFPLGYTLILLMIYIFDSLWNIVAFLLFNGEFRKVCKKLFKCSRNQNTVTPIANIGGSDRSPRRSINV